MKKGKRDKILKVLRQTKVYSFFRDRIEPHLRSFWIPWALLCAMLLVSWCFDNEIRMSSLYVLMGLFVIALILRPMNVIHGLIGTRGDIKMFFFMFLLINLLFSGIYYQGFFRYAGITFDVSQPHVEFNIFENQGRDVEALMIEKEEPVVWFKKGKARLVDMVGEHIKGIRGSEKGRQLKKTRIYEHLPQAQTDLAHYYHRIGRIWVVQNTFLTSLMQEPTEFYSFTCTYTGNHDINDKNAQIATGFQWFLVFHILVSWVFLGVFISLIYQKFRNM